MSKQALAALRAAVLPHAALAKFAQDTPGASYLRIGAGTTTMIRCSHRTIRSVAAAKQLLLMLAALLASAFTTASLLHADTVLFSNVSSDIPEGSGAIQGASIEDLYIATAFAFTPTVTATFADALVDLWAETSNTTDANVTASLYSNSVITGDTPGTLLAQLDTATAPTYSSLPFLPFDSNDTSFTQTSGPAVTLLAGTEYWLVLSPGDANSSLLYAYGNGATFDVPMAQQLPTQTSAWISDQPANVELQIDGTVTPSAVPEPANLLLLTSGLILCAGSHFVRRRRSV